MTAVELYWRPMKTTDADGEIVLCISTRVDGDALLRELARLGCRVVLLTLDEHRDAEWPREILHEFHTMPDGLTQEQITNTVTYLARRLKFARIIAVNESDLKMAAALREHMRIPGMGLTTTRYFRDRLAMCAKAANLGVRVSAFASIMNYDVLRAYMENVAAPWLLQPRCTASTVGAQTLQEAQQVWGALEELGDSQSNFLLEQWIAGDIFFVDGITAEGKVVFAAVRPAGDEVGNSPTRGTQENEVQTPCAASTHSTDGRELKAIHASLIPALGLVRGVTHTKFLRSHASGELYFLETSARVADAATVEAIEQAYGINLWVEWARVEVAALCGQTYRLPVPDESAAKAGKVSIG